jgi:hypothetical protein
MRLKPYNIGTCKKGLRVNFHVVTLFSKSSLINFCNFLKIPSILKGKRTLSADIELVWCVLVTANSEHCSADNVHIAYRNSLVNFVTCIIAFHNLKPSRLPPNKLTAWLAHVTTLSV